MKQYCADFAIECELKCLLRFQSKKQTLSQTAERHCDSLANYSMEYRYRNVTACALVQGCIGANSTELIPLVMPF